MPRGNKAGAVNSWVEVEGGRLWMRQEGAGAPLVLMHGWTVDHRMFEPQLMPLAEHFRVIAYDRRGFGRSQAPPGLAQELNDLDRIAAALSLDDFHLLGMSQGARLALRYAATRPHRLRSLVLQGGSADGVVVEEAAADQAPFAEFAALARAGKMEEMRRRWAAHPLLAVDRARPQVRPLLDRMLADYDGADLLDYSPAYLDFDQDVPGLLAKFDAPALILSGALEVPGRRKHARRLLEIIPDSREIVLEGGGHFCNMATPDAYNAAVIAFCADADRTFNERRHP